jgi:hypothetical protein
LPKYSITIGPVASRPAMTWDTANVYGAGSSDRDPQVVLG